MCIDSFYWIEIAGNKSRMEYYHKYRTKIIHSIKMCVVPFNRIHIGFGVFHNFYTKFHHVYTLTYRIAMNAYIFNVKRD